MGVPPEEPLLPAPSPVTGPPVVRASAEPPGVQFTKSFGACLPGGTFPNKQRAASAWGTVCVPLVLPSDCRQLPTEQPAGRQADSLLRFKGAFLSNHEDVWRGVGGPCMGTHGPGRLGTQGGASVTVTGKRRPAPRRYSRLHTLQLCTGPTHTGWTAWAMGSQCLHPLTGCIRCAS